MSGTVVIGVVDDGVVGVALHGFGKAIQDGGLVILAVLVAAGFLLVELVAPTGFEEVGQLEPLVHFAIVPAVTHGKGRKGSIYVFLEEFNGLVNPLEAAQVDGLARRIHGKGILGQGILIRHFAIEVRHEHEAIGQKNLGHTGIVPVFGRHCLGIQILEGRASSHKEPLVRSGYLAFDRIPVGNMPIVTTAIVAGPVSHGHTGTPGSELGGAVCIELAVGQFELVFRRIQRRVFRVYINIEPFVTGGNGEGCNDQTAQKYRFEKFHNR